MKINKSLINLSHLFLSIVILTLSLFVSGKAKANDGTIELYAKIHFSIDRAHDGQDDALSLSNNSTRFGLQGEHNIEEGPDFVWRLEQKVYLDESGGRFGNPAYAGFKGNMGRVLAGFIDTPYKSFISKFNVMDDSIADVRSIMGYTAMGANATDNLNVRARNAIFYEYKWIKYRIAVLYSAEKDDSGTTTGVDDNSEDGYSASFDFIDDHLSLGMAAESWNGSKQLRGLRLGGRYKKGDYGYGLIWERIDSPYDPDYRRDAYAFDIGYSYGKANRLKFQYQVAQSSEGVTDSGARMLSIGNYYQLDKAITLYVNGVRLNNEANAKYRLGTSGHGDIVAPAYGKDSWAISFGVIYKIAKLF